MPVNFKNSRKLRRFVTKDGKNILLGFGNPIWLPLCMQRFPFPVSLANGLGFGCGPIGLMR